MKFVKLSVLATTAILMTNVIHAIDPEKLPETFAVCRGNDSQSHGNNHRRFKNHPSNANWGNLQQFGAVTEDSLAINGGVKLNGTSVTNQVSVNGVLVGVNANIGSIQANGKVRLFNTTVQNSVDVNGFFVARKSTFQGPLSFSSDKIFISNSTADSIYIRATGNANQVVVVAWGANVNTIEFESGTGTVIQKGSTTVVGTVIGGTVVVKD